MFKLSMKYKPIILVALGLLFFSGGASAAKQYLDWDVESGTISSKFPYYTGRGAVEISSAKAHSGTKSIYYNPYTVGDHTDTPALALPNLQTVYATWWWWIPSTLEGGEGGQHFFRFGSAAAGDPNYWYRGQLDPTISAPGAKGFGVDLFDGAGGDSLSKYHSIVPSLPTNQWFKFAILATINSPGGTPNGVLRIWINGTEVYSNTNVLFAATTGAPLPGTKWSRFAMVTNFDNATATTGYWYMDDIEVWDGVPDGDNAVPAPPTDVAAE